VKIEGDVASIDLDSNTPNLMTYQMKESTDGEWKDISNPLSITLKNDRNEMFFRPINLAGVPGTTYQVIVAR